MTTTLLTKAIPQLEKDEVLMSLKRLPSPYETIAKFGKRPTLKGTENNRQLAHTLKNKAVISSFKEEKGKIRINTYNKNF